MCLHVSVLSCVCLCVCVCVCVYVIVAREFDSVCRVCVCVHVSGYVCVCVHVVCMSACVRGFMSMCQSGCR